MLPKGYRAAKFFFDSIIDGLEKEKRERATEIARAWFQVGRYAGALLAHKKAVGAAILQVNKEEFTSYPFYFRPPSKSRRELHKLSLAKKEKNRLQIYQ